MDMLIVLIGFSAAAGGALVLLVCLAGRRAQLVKAFNMQQEQEAREKQVEEIQAKQNQAQSAVALPLSEE